MLLIKRIFASMLVGLMFGPYACATKSACNPSGFDQQHQADIGFCSDRCEAHQQQARSNM
jgi:hypothetical protein